MGCKLNYAETSTYERGFRNAGLEVVQWNDSADVYLVNTCSVTGHSDNKCRNIIRKCHRISPSAAIVVTGCYAELKRDEIRSIEGVSLVFGAKEKNAVVSETLKLLEGRAAQTDSSYRNLSPAQEYRDISSVIMPAFSSGERTRSFLKVQDGCDNFCAYCTVPYARGESRNIPIERLVAQAREIAGKGIKEIVLTGVNTGDFGKSTGENFIGLIKALEKVDGIERFRISSIEPNLLSDEIIDFTAASDKFMPHFHIPLQTGSDFLLKSMGRRYDTSLFAEKVERIRNSMESSGKQKVFFGIDVIAGLPGESDDFFQETYDFLAEVIRPAFIHVFPYSKRPGTRAFSMQGQVRDGIKTERVKKLEELCTRLHHEFVESNRGLKSKVLWEGSCKDGKMSGYSENYIRVDRPFDADRNGTVEEVTL